MPIKAQYKILAGTSTEVERQLSVLNITGSQNWKPLMMTSVLTPKGIMLNVLAEYEIPQPKAKKNDTKATDDTPFVLGPPPAGTNLEEMLKAPEE